MGKWSENHGKMMEHGKVMGNPYESHGKTMNIVDLSIAMYSYVRNYQRVIGMLGKWSSENYDNYGKTGRKW